ncbi:enoyl-ACP reductase [Gluconacetobacter sacchari DSM 12717]|uniref:Nitronate monooxygenase n=2 Tax=Gluconacetobacter sacchari TaxID=92759 RepID=A0A7W4NPN8_9PROT|nr:nitronate monooxygenase [Gluconacetobacter sacchari]MBB2161804.1 nitronate monooxygenase [Gluconacetobacter sacchari]GBQ20189.1 enoyl-ACP reductase [Gluconacetobacter sacchari DSM 12717]
MAETQGRAFLTAVGIRLPIFQAPMAGVSSPALAAAVSEAGGLGALGLGASNVDAAARMIAELKERTKYPFNLNVFCHKSSALSPEIEVKWIERFREHFTAEGGVPPSALREIYRSFVVDEEISGLLLAARPRVVSFHFGLPGADTIQALRTAGVLLLCSVTNLSEAQTAVAAGVHAVIAQGYEAGGHRGIFDPSEPDDLLSTAALTQMLVRHVKVPVIAAGGIMDGAGIVAAMKLGAAAAQLGTAFVACDESLADDAYRAALTGSAGYHTVMTSIISGRPARCLANRYTELSRDILVDEVPAYPVAYDLAKALNAAAKVNGRADYGAQWAGQGAPLARRMPAGDLVRVLAKELELAAG